MREYAEKTREMFGTEIYKKYLVFMVVFEVINANPNGDPLCGNMPRTNLFGEGVMSTECIRRKLRNVLQELGYDIMMIADDRLDDDELESVFERVMQVEEIAEELKKKKIDKRKIRDLLCSKYTDVAFYGVVPGFKQCKSDFGIKGACTVEQATSIGPVDVVGTQITKSFRTEPNDGKKEASSMGMRYSVPYGLYTFSGSITKEEAEKNHITEDRVEGLKMALKNLFYHDATAARPDGSMNVMRVYFWEQDGPVKYDKRTLKDSIRFEIKNEDGAIEKKDDLRIVERVFDDLKPEVYHQPCDRIETVQDEV